jgi:hypothetical protein
LADCYSGCTQNVVLQAHPIGANKLLKAVAIRNMVLIWSFRTSACCAAKVFVAEVFLRWFVSDISPEAVLSAFVDAQHEVQIFCC